MIHNAGKGRSLDAAPAPAPANKLSAAERANILATVIAFGATASGQRTGSLPRSKVHELVVFDQGKRLVEPVQ